MTKTSSEKTVSGVLLRWAGMGIVGALALLALVFIGDYVVFLLRGKPLDEITLNQYMTAPLKDNKTEYYYEGTGPVQCSRTLFPQSGYSPCWQLRKHTSVSETP